MRTFIETSLGGEAELVRAVRKLLDDLQRHDQLSLRAEIERQQPPGLLDSSDYICPRQHSESPRLPGPTQTTSSAGVASRAAPLCHISPLEATAMDVINANGMSPGPRRTLPSIPAVRGLRTGQTASINQDFYGDVIGRVNAMAYEVNDLRKELRLGRGEHLDLVEEVKVLRQQQVTADATSIMQSMTVAAFGKQLNRNTLLLAKQQEKLEGIEMQISQLGSTIESAVTELRGAANYLDRSHCSASTDHPGKKGLPPAQQKPLPSKQTIAPAGDLQYTEACGVIAKPGNKVSKAGEQALKRQSKAQADAAAQKRQRVEDGDPLSPLIKPGGCAALSSPAFKF